jgi:hypothetical protein
MSWDEEAADAAAVKDAVVVAARDREVALAEWAGPLPPDQAAIVSARTVVIKSNTWLVSLATAKNALNAAHK